MIQRNKKKGTKTRNQRGFSLMEVLVASAMLSVAVGGAVAVQTTVMQRTTSVNDRTFAAQKATQMFEELRSFVQANRETDISKLQNFSDGSRFNNVLSTERKEVDSPDGLVSRSIDDPGDPISANQRNSGKWKFVRQVQVNPVPNDEFARFVKVSVWYADPNNNDLPVGYDPNSNEDLPKPLASVAGILKTNLTAAPPTQVVDVFILAMENAPSWWVDLADLRPSFERTLTDLEQRNPGLRYRRHFVTRLGYGRDPYYMPYINDADEANDQPLPWIYLYPGRINHSSINENYPLAAIRGRVRTDDTTRFPHVNNNHPHYDVNGFNVPGHATGYRPYAMADQFNHVMRWPEQLAMEKRLSTTDPFFARNPSLVNFLEDLNTPLNDNGDPMQGGEMRYRNAIVINLHGELLPLPPIRNYSDPAKQPDQIALKLNGTPAPDVASLPAAKQSNGDTEIDPNYVSLQNKRVVSHPENLRYDNGAEVAWRVYAYEQLNPGENRLSNPGDTGYSSSVSPEDHSIPKTSLFIPTIGQGPNYNDFTRPGYLRYPNFTPADFTSTNNPLKIERIVGGENVRYRRWSTDSSRHEGRTNVSRITDNHDPSCTPGATETDCLYPARILGQTSAPATGTTLTLNTWSSDLAGASLTDARDDLRGQLIVLDPGGANEQIVRINEVNAISGPTAVIQTNQALSVPAGVTVTRHRDFSVEAIDETMMGAPQRGYRVMLYDTPTRHPIGPSNTGLRKDRRLYGLEYIPAPVADDGTDSFDDRDLREGNSDRYKNTARWRVALDTGASVLGSNFNSQQLTLETRIVHNDADPDAPAASRREAPYRNAPDSDELGCPLTIRELCDGVWGDGDVHVPNNPATPVNENERDMRPHLYNVSRTYTYMGHIFTLEATTPPANSLLVPQVEQAQYLGDALYTPYLDVKVRHRYSRHWGGPNNKGVEGFSRNSGPSFSGIDTDLNWYFQFFNHGLLRSNAIYNSVSGYSNYYHALGGELGTDGTNAVFQIRRQPWSQSPDGSSVANSNNLINEITGDERRTILSTDDTTPGGGNERWRAQPTQKELFPDQDYQFWVDNGNLPNHSYVSGTHNRSSAEPTNNRRFFRSPVDNGPYALSGTRRRRMKHTGSGGFMNGNPTGSGNRRVNHSFTGGNAVLNGDAGEAGRLLVRAFNLTLPDTVTSNRPFTIDSGATGGIGGYGDPEISSLRNTLGFVNSGAGTVDSTANRQNTYYRHSSSSNTASGMVKMTRSGRDEMAGYVLLNGFANTSGTGVMLMARMSQAGTLQTFMDAGDLSIPGDAPGRTVQLPRIEITSPTAQRAYDDPASIEVNFTTAWKRWDNEKYSQAYPDNWWDTTPLVYNLKYSVDNGRTWRYADDGTEVPREMVDQYNPAKSLFSPYTLDASEKAQPTVNWDVSTLPQGNYLLRAEVYRAGFPEMGYGYHDVLVTINR
ncbi:MAG: prepilin-type N-terminal cleavage/methylation domain-containing protein [Candidatus Sericytochromatia bacterium]|nr:prepilin-type N-terminal cleavage/methylation domain-containing protein [Candidatus Sericytochromatia bacterium]